MIQKVFFAFCGKDNKAAKKILYLLRHCDVKCSGMFILQREELVESIRTSDYFVFLLSKDSLKTCENELRIAAHFNKPVLFVNLNVKSPASALRGGSESRLYLSSSGGNRHVLEMKDKGFEYRFMEELGMRALYEADHLPEASEAKQEKSDTRRGFFSLFSRKKNRQEPPEPVPKGEAQPLKPDKVRFSALAPAEFKPDEYAMIDILMYEEAYRKVVEELKQDAPEPVKETTSGLVMAEKASAVKVVLSSPDVQIEDNTQTQEWQGEYLRYTFAVLPPAHLERSQLLFSADVYINDVIATKLKFTVRCAVPDRQQPQLTRSDVLSAFISYASKDRKRVAAIIQGMKRARPDLDVFFDVESLHSGDKWESILRREIDNRDVLYLCWSSNAAKAEWVDYEWRYALKHKGIDSIEPIPLEPPESCPPPAELMEKHFNDKLLYVINYR